LVPRGWYFGAHVRPENDPTCAYIGRTCVTYKRPDMCGIWAHMCDLKMTPQVWYLGAHVRPKMNPHMRIYVKVIFEIL
jgi:hypothetical protein